MRSRLLLVGLLPAMLVGSYAMTFAGQTQPSAGRHVVYVPMVARDLRRALQPEATTTVTETSTATATAETPTPTTTATTSIEATTTATSSASCDPEADLSGALTADNQGQIVNRSAACSYQVGLASYRAFDRHIHNQELFDSATATVLPGETLDLTVDIPDCAAQIDLFYGPLLPSLDNQRYGERLLDSHFTNGTTFCAPGTPPPTRSATPTVTGTSIPVPTETPTTTPTETPGGGG